MQVDDAARERGQHGLFQHPHKAREHDEVHTRVSQQFHQFRLHRGLEASPKFPGRQVRIWNTEFPRDVENAGIKNIGDN
jgi:hypothetical protein